jgi:uncharacterized phiE125 gp8 family phage protein
MLTPLAPFDGETILPLADARVQLNLTADDDHHDDAVTSSRDLAIGWLEGYASVSLQERDWLWVLDQFSTVIELPRGPLSDVPEVKYYDGDGTDLTIDAADYSFGRNRLVAAVGAAWPYANGYPGGVRVTFTAGFATADDIPLNLMASLKLATTAFFENRSNPDLRVAMMMADQMRPIL